MPRNPADRPPAPEGIGFYHGPFSSFNGGPFILRGHDEWPEWRAFGPVIKAKTAEHPFQAAKTLDTKDVDWILAAMWPSIAKWRGSRQGEQQPDGTRRRIILRDDWEEIKFGIMHRVTYAKFEQLPPHRAALLATGTAFLYEDSPTDNIWGLWDRRAWDWTGQNLLGKVLMQVREELRVPDDR